MRTSNVERRAAMEAVVANVNTILSSRFGQKYGAVLRTSPGKVDKIVIQRHTVDSEQESRVVLETT